MVFPFNSRWGLILLGSSIAACAGFFIHAINEPHIVDAQSACWPTEEESAAIIAGKSVPLKPGCTPVASASPAAPGTEPIALEPAIAEPVAPPPVASAEPSPASGKVSVVLSDAESYGTGNGLTPEQSIAIQSIAMPQSYGAMTRRFGYPDRRDSEADYYQLSDGRWARIGYDANNRATWIGISQ